MVNSTNYVEIDGAFYVLDLDALCKYIVGDDNEKIIQKTKTEQWVMPEDEKIKDMELVTKEITESSSARKDEHAPFRAEIAKMMLQLIMYPTVGDNGETKELKSFSGVLTVGQAIAVNTMIREGIIKEITFDEDGEEE